MGKYITPTFPSKTKRFYDANGNIIKIQVQVNEQGKSERYATTVYEYDKMNRPICVTQNSSIIQYSYDAMGNVTKMLTGQWNKMDMSNVIMINGLGTIHFLFKKWLTRT